MKKRIHLLEEYLERLEQNGHFSGSILVGYKGEILLSRGFGYASLEHDIPNSAQTKFRIASITKGFTAAAILLLQEKEILSIHDPISRYLPDYPYGNKITIHHLLSHTSGIPNFTSFKNYWPYMMRLPTTLDQTIESFKHLPLEFSPGEKYTYCNSGYLLLTKIVERVSGISYAEFLKQSIFDPLQMKDTNVDNGRHIVKNMATGYTVLKEIVHAEHIDMSIPQGAYGLYSTVEDLFRWDQALYTDQLLSFQSLQQMFTPQLHQYGYGWSIQSIDLGESKHTCIKHKGSINGFQSDILRFIDDQLTIIVLSNFHLTPVTWIGKNLAKLFFGYSFQIPQRI